MSGLAMAGKRAVDFIRPGMTVGLGTGRSASEFIRQLSLKYGRGSIVCVASSASSKELAQSLGLSLREFNEVDGIDVTVDGADEIDTEKRLIKGLGGALLKEKLLALASKELIIVATQEKMVKKLGERGILPIEALPFGYLFTEKRLNALGYHGKWRKTGGELFSTELGNLIYDIRLKPIADPEKTESGLKAIAGVVATGLFLNMANKIIISDNSGDVKLF